MQFKYGLVINLTRVRMVLVMVVMMMRMELVMVVVMMMSMLILIIRMVRRAVDSLFHFMRDHGHVGVIFFFSSASSDSPVTTYVRHWSRSVRLFNGIKSSVTALCSTLLPTAAKPAAPNDHDIYTFTSTNEQIYGITKYQCNP
ncbi:hypothetical protein PoB_001350900 [Plakobranchus ocellatus]|uniref:Uncharacterized protein n=1 Tax=Plakobranchus ocellatus TaxID=259542 RepID=A0AAV3YY13_9GAST|nr:hypothetical protein PoB_001350900 [Plakobranchus ocellatus]